MFRSISIVEYKVQQTHFFLEQLQQARYNMFAAQCFTDAFTSSARSVTFALQTVLHDVSGFGEWYKYQQKLLKEDYLARFFNEYRIALTHIGDTVVRAGLTQNNNGKYEVQYFFMPIHDVTNVPDSDVVTTCHRYFEKILALIFDAFENFKYELDDRWYFTYENFERMGKTLEDAIVELGFPSTWMDTAIDIDSSEKWQILRRTQTIGCQINDLFSEHLGKIIISPDDISI